MNLNEENKIAEMTLEELIQEHHNLEKQLGKLEKHPHSDHEVIREAKKLKLRIKDQIESLNRQ
jgi:hypothetical protein